MDEPDGEDEEPVCGDGKARRRERKRPICGDDTFAQFRASGCVKERNGEARTQFFRDIAEDGHFHGIEGDILFFVVEGTGNAPWHALSRGIVTSGLFSACTARTAASIATTSSIPTTRDTGHTLSILAHIIAITGAADAVAAVETAYFIGAVGVTDGF